MPDEQCWASLSLNDVRLVGRRPRRSGRSPEVVAALESGPGPSLRASVSSSSSMPSGSVVLVEGHGVGAVAGTAMIARPSTSVTPSPTSVPSLLTSTVIVTPGSASGCPRRPCSASLLKRHVDRGAVRSAGSSALPVRRLGLGDGSTALIGAPTSHGTRQSRRHDEEPQTSAITQHARMPPCRRRRSAGVRAGSLGRTSPHERATGSPSRATATDL